MLVFHSSIIANVTGSWRLQSAPSGIGPDRSAQWLSADGCMALGHAVSASSVCRMAISLSRRSHASLHVTAGAHSRRSARWFLSGRIAFVRNRGATVLRAASRAQLHEARRRAAAAGAAGVRRRGAHGRQHVRAAGTVRDVRQLRLSAYHFGSSRRTFVRTILFLADLTTTSRRFWHSPDIEKKDASALPRSHRSCGFARTNDDQCRATR